MGKYRIKGKFVKFKDFIKINGLDAVNYELLSAQEKRVWNGVQTYQNRVVLDNGQFVNKTTLSRLYKNKNYQQFAEKNNKDIKTYIKENIDIILKFDTQAFSISKNQNNVEKFIQETNGKLFFKGKEIEKNNLIQALQLKRTRALKKGKFITIYYFKIEKNGNKITLEKIEEKGSE